MLYKANVRDQNYDLPNLNLIGVVIQFNQPPIGYYKFFFIHQIGFPFHRNVNKFHLN